LNCSKLINNEETFIQNYTAGDIFGEYALLYNVPSDFTITATSNCKLYALGIECFNLIVKDVTLRKMDQ